MATAFTGLTSGSGSGATPSVSSISPTAGSVAWAVVASNVFSGTARTHSISGNNLTWTSVGEILFQSDVYRCTVFKGLGGSPSAGSPTITLTGASSVNGHVFAFFETSETNTTTPNVQSATNSSAGDDPNTLTVTLSALADAVNNAVFAAFCNDNATATQTPSTGYTELYDIAAGSSLDVGIAVHYKIPGSTTPGTTVSQAFADIGGVAIEIDWDTGGGGRTTKNTRSWSLGRNVGMGFRLPI
jgi:hypothetical protein